MKSLYIENPIWLILLFSMNGCFMLFTLAHYPGQGYIYVLFSILLNSLLYFGFKFGSIFFDTFLGVFFWIGYWLKFSGRIVFANGHFHESVGYFDFTPDGYDRALLVTSCGVAGLLCARVIRRYFLFKSLAAFKYATLDGVRSTYIRHRKTVWVGFCIVVLCVTVTNAFFGIYQRGSVPRTILPYGLGGIYTWFMLFGASSISATLLHFELQKRRGIAYWVILIVLLEPFCSNISMLSRGMILNSGALFLGIYVGARKEHISFSARSIGLALATMIVLFVVSIFVVNQLRIVSFVLPPVDTLSEQMSGLWGKLWLLMVDRWVGMEGVLAISSYPDLGWSLWNEVWDEKYLNHGTSFYDRVVSMSYYTRSDLTNRHFVSLPGILAFFFYPGSYWFLFVAMFCLGLAGAAIEAAVFKWGGGNLILCSLMAFIIAYRYVHFGYVPGRSYLLLGTVALNVALIYLAGRVFSKYSTDEKKGGSVPERKASVDS